MTPLSLFLCIQTGLGYCTRARLKFWLFIYHKLPPPINNYKSSRRKLQLFFLIVFPHSFLMPEMNIFARS